MTLFTDEKTFIISVSGEVTLTTHRIWQTGNGRTTSMMLENTSSCKSVVGSNTTFLIIILLLEVVQNNQMYLPSGVLPFGHHFEKERRNLHFLSHRDHYNKCKRNV